MLPQELLKEWHATKNRPLTPETVPDGYNLPLWWKCLNKRHVYKLTIQERLSRGFGCKKCTLQTELILQKWLSEQYPDLITQATFSWAVSIKNRPYRYDFFIPSMKVIIELDGEQHFTKVKRRWEKPALIRARDVHKMKLALKNDLSVVRLLQNDVFYNKTDWKSELSGALSNLQKGVVYLTTTDKYILHKQDTENWSFCSLINE
jgi:very-short-patch-repair endonuclease